MARRLSVPWVMALLVAQSAWAAGDKPTPVSADEARNWIRHTTPLPKQIDIIGKVTVPAADVAIQLRDDTVPLARQAAKELREALGVSEDAKTSDHPAFTLSLELGAAEAAKLKDLPRSDQAYLIEPADGSLRLIALGHRGLYYASKTMQQLIKAKAREGRVEMPIVQITDCRTCRTGGLWGGDASQYLRWLSDRKMNYLEHISNTTIDKDKKCHVHYPDFKQVMIDDGPTYGINPCLSSCTSNSSKVTVCLTPIPSCRARTPRKASSATAIRSSATSWPNGSCSGARRRGSPKSTSGWPRTCGARRPASATSAKKADRAVLEARAIIKAWEIAKKQLPNLGLRVLTSEASESCNARIIPTLPKDVKLWYYHSLFTYKHRAHPDDRKVPALPDRRRQGRPVGRHLPEPQRVRRQLDADDQPRLHPRTHDRIRRQGA